MIEEKPHPEKVLALALSEIVHEECGDVPHDIGDKLMEPVLDMVKKSGLEWVEVGGVNVGMQTVPKGLVLRSKYCEGVMKRLAEQTCRVAGLSRQLHQLQMDYDAIKNETEN